MKRTLFLLACATAFAETPAWAQSMELSPVDAGGRANLRPQTTTKVILVGDSTVSVQSGWGGAFCARHVTSAIACIDLAREGRSTYSFRAQGLWQIALAEMAAGKAYKATYVLIQFGHNDQPGKPGHSTALGSEFPDNLRAYVHEVRAAGAIPVLVTPLARRQFTGGVLQDSLAPWVKAIRQVAAEQRVPLVDLHARSTAAVMELGPLGSTRFAQLPAPVAVVKSATEEGTVPVRATADRVSGQPNQRQSEVTNFAKVNPTFDVTHLGSEGAEFFASLVTEELAKAIPDLQPQLVR